MLGLAGAGEKLFDFEDVSYSAKLQDYLEIVLVIQFKKKIILEIVVKQQLIQTSIINWYQIVIIFKAITVKKKHFRTII